MSKAVIARNRIIYGGLAIGTLLIGFMSRRFFSDYSFVNLYVGDGLWALMIYWGFVFIFPKWSIRTIAMVALTFCVGIELSQLYHAAWIDNIRATTVGGLILGFSFVWSDLICYALGVSLGALVEMYLMPSRTGVKRQSPVTSYDPWV